MGNVMGKRFSMVVCERWDAHDERVGQRAEGRAGFHRDRCIVDHVFVLRHLIDKIRNGRAGRQLYACFVDFRKAYDTILRPRVMSMGHARYTWLHAPGYCQYVLGGFLTNQDVAEVGGPLPEHHMCEPSKGTLCFSK